MTLAMHPMASTFGADLRGLPPGVKWRPPEGWARTYHLRLLRAGSLSAAEARALVERLLRVYRECGSPLDDVADVQRHHDARKGQKLARSRQEHG
jgi:hypothetical protein